MRLKQWLFRGILIIAIFGISMGFGASAQEARDCVAIFVEFADLVDTGERNLEMVAEIQALRRELDAQEEPPCPPAAYDALLSALNLTADTIVAELVNNADLAARLGGEAETQRALAAELLLDTPIGSITMPQEGDTVELELQVIGTYNATLIDDNHYLWLLLEAPNVRLYPQALNTCESNRTPIPGRPDGTWRLRIGVGRPEDEGQLFTLVLVVANAEANAFINGKLDEWCAVNDHEGLELAEVYENAGIEVIQSVNVFREEE